MHQIGAESEVFMERLKCGAENKFIVLKRDDVNQLSPFLQEQIDLACFAVSANRAAAGKEPCPEYLVINTDEPYAPEVIEILKRNGHWG